ncbi:hypothetical protein VRY54_02355 [Actinomyces sp. F1_1611]
MAEEDDVLPPVTLLGAGDELAQLVAEVAQLARVRVVRASAVRASAVTGPDPGLVLVASGAKPAAGRWVRVGLPGEDTDLQLPRDGPQLARLLAGEAAGRVRTACRTLVVAGWQGGVGVSTAARNLAELGEALLLDASGQPPSEQVRPGDWHWGLVDPDDPPLVGSLDGLSGRIASRRGVQSLPDDPVTVGDPRVAALLGICRTDAVVDAGRWTPALARFLLQSTALNRRTRLILLGRGGEQDSLRLVNLLAASPAPWLPSGLLCRGRVSEELLLVAQRWSVPVQRLFPPHSRRGQRQLRRIWAEVG